MQRLQRFKRFFLMGLISCVAMTLPVENSVRAHFFPRINGWWTSSGGTFGFTDKRFTYGGELSLLYIPEKSLMAMGFVTDFVHDNRLRSRRMTIGPEVAFFFVGIDGGLALNFRDGKTRTGFSIRPFLTIPFFISPVVYYRYTTIGSREPGQSLHEFGMQVKVAIPLHRI